MNKESGTFLGSSDAEEGGKSKSLTGDFCPESRPMEGWRGANRKGWYAIPYWDPLHTDRSSRRRVKVRTCISSCIWGPLTVFALFDSETDL